MAKIETYTDGFTDLSGWQAALAAEGYDTFFVNCSAVAGVAQLDGAGGQYAIMETVGTYTFQDSWYSVEVDLSGLPATVNYSQVQFNVLDDAGFNLYDSFSLYWSYDGTTGPDPTKMTLGLGGATSTLDVISIGSSIILGFRDTGGLIAGFYSLDGASTWTQVGDGTTATIRPGDTPFNLLAIIAGAPDQVSAIVNLDNFNLHEPPAIGGPDPTSIIGDVGEIAIVGLAGTFTLPTPKIHTFTSDFTSLTGFTPGGPATVSAVSGQGKIHIPAHTNPGYGQLYTDPTHYVLDESWVSVKLVNPTDLIAVGVTNDQFSLVAQDRDSTFAFYEVMLQYVGSLWSIGTIVYDGTSSTTHSGSISLTGGDSVVLGMRVHNGYFSSAYSKDNGATWTKIYSGPYVAPGGATDLYHILTVQADNPSSDLDLFVDDFNLHTPPDYSNFDVTGSAAGAIAVTGMSGSVTRAYEVNLSTPSPIHIVGKVFGSPTFGPPSVTGPPGIISLFGKPVTVSLSAPAPSITMQAGEINIAGIAGGVIVGSFVPGDPFSAPIVIRESGAGTYTMNSMTLEAGEPTTSYTKSMWLAYQADGPMTVNLSATSGSAFTMEMFDGDTLDNLSVAAIGSTLNHDVNSGLTYIRLTNSTNTTIDLTWNYTVTPGSLMMDVLTDFVDRTPNIVTAAVQGGFPGESIQFTWSPPINSLITSGTPRPITLATVTADSEGNIHTASLPIPAEVHGTYIINAKGLTSGHLASDTFIILNDPAPADSTGSSATPVPSVSIKWLWDDGTSTTWVMQNNPDSMTSVIRPKVLLNETTTSGTGQNIIWQGATPAINWSFNGTVLSESEYNQLVYFRSLNRKFYITTHRNETYVVSVKNLDIRPRKNGSNFWTFDYTVDLNMYGGV